MLPHAPPLDIPNYIRELASSSKFASPSPSHYFSRVSLVHGASPLHLDSPEDSADDELASSPPGSSGGYHYADRGSRSYNASIPSETMYDKAPNSAPYSASSFSSASNNHASYTPSNSSALRDPVDTSYLSESPSPEHFLHSGAPPYPGDDRANPHQDTLPENYTQEALADKYTSATSSSSHFQNSLLDQRRMSEPAVLGSANLYATQVADTNTGGRYDQFPFAFSPPPNNNSRSPSSTYVPSLQRGSSLSSLRDLRQQYTDSHTRDNDHSDHDHFDSYEQTDGFDEPVSSLHDFSGGLMNSPSSGLDYSPTTESFYGPSPPNTGTSTTSSNAPLGLGFSSPQFIRRSSNLDGNDPLNSKTYSFVALPGNAVKKRPRRRYDEIERLYQCSWPDCSKSYGTLNHLNAHVSMQKHGPKRSPAEFKELRKQWRKAKKDAEVPSSGAMRRGTISLRHDGIYNLRYGQHMQHRYSQHSDMMLPSSMTIQPGSNERYSLSGDEMRYSPSDRDHHLAGYSNVARHRYSGSSPWNPNSFSISRNNVESYLSNSLPSTHSRLHPSDVYSHPSQSHQSHPHVSSGSSQNRLPPGSTLLTPLPGYHAPTLLPPLQVSGDLTYPSEGYEVYDKDSNGTSTNGHTTIGPGSGDEYEHHS